MLGFVVSNRDGLDELHCVRVIWLCNTALGIFGVRVLGYWAGNDTVSYFTLNFYVHIPRRIQQDIS